MDGIKILRNENKIPICSGYDCKHLLNENNIHNELDMTCVPLGLVMFPSKQMNYVHDDNIIIEEINNDDYDLKDALYKKLLERKLSYKIKKNTCNNKVRLKMNKTRKV